MAKRFGDIATEHVQLGGAGRTRGLFSRDGVVIGVGQQGAVFANLAARPIETDGWLILGDPSLINFADRPELAADEDDIALAQEHFGGTPDAPLSLSLSAESGA